VGGHTNDLFRPADIRFVSVAIGFLSVDVPLFPFLKPSESIYQIPTHGALKSCKDAPKFRPDYF